MKNKTCRFLIPSVFLFLFGFAWGQSLTGNDIDRIAEEVNLGLKGKVIGNGLSLINCTAVGRSLRYEYEVPDSWLPSSTIKEDLITDFEASGIMQFYENNGMTLIFRYLKGNNLVKEVVINGNGRKSGSFKLADYVNLQGHPKVKGVNLKLKSPENWQVLEGDRPNIVKKFVDGTNVFLVLIKENSTFFSRNEAKELLNDEDFQTEFIRESCKIFQDYDVHDQRIITIDTYPTYEYTVSGNFERSGYTMNVIMKYWVVFYEDKIVNFQASGMDNGSFQQRNDLYFSIINSVIFPDQYSY